MNIICVVSNDIFRFKVFINNLPECISNYKLIFVTDPRLGDKIDCFKKLSPETDVISSREVLNEYHNILSTTNPNVDKYPLGYKMILPWYISRKYNLSKLFLLDDDIILTNKLDYLFENIDHPSSVATTFMGSSLGLHGLNSTLIEKALSINGIESNVVVPYINGGNILFSNDINFDEYIASVKEYLESDIVTELISKQKYWWSYYIDEVFFSALFKQYSKHFKGVYDLYKHVKQYVVCPSNVEKHIMDIGANIEKYALTHYAPFDTDTLYPQLIKKGYLKGDE